MELERLVEYIGEVEVKRANPMIESEIVEEVEEESLEVEALDNKDEDKKLIEVLWSSDERKVLDTLSIIDKNVSAEFLAVILGVAKVYNNLTIRKKALEVLKNFGGEMALLALKICEKKRYLQTSNEKKIKSDFERLEKIVGFRVDILARYIALKHPLNLGHYYFIQEDSDEVEEFILKYFPKRAVLLEGVSPRFLKARELVDLTVGEFSKSLWQMDFVEQLEFNFAGRVLQIPKELKGLSSLKRLIAYAKEIEVKGSSDSITRVSLQGCQKLTFDKEAYFPNIKELLFLGFTDEFEFDTTGLHRAFPNLEMISTIEKDTISADFLITDESTKMLFQKKNKFLEEHRYNIFKLFPNIKFQVIKRENFMDYPELEHKRSMLAIDG